MISKRKLKRKNQRRIRASLDREIRMMRLMQRILSKSLEKEKETGVRLMSKLIVSEPLPPNTESRESIQKRWDEFVKNHGNLFGQSRDEADDK